MSTSSTIKRSRTRRAGESAYGLLLLARNVLMVLSALLLLIAGAWTSWDTAQHAMLSSGRERGTMKVAACGSDECSGPFVPTGGEGIPRAKVTISKAVTHETGETLDVAVRPGTDDVVRTGPGGILYAWMPFAGALLLTALLVGGGLRLRRTGYAVGLLGAALMGATFVAL